MKKRVLLLAPSFMNIYMDIIKGLEASNMEVVWVEDGQIKGNPYNKRNINHATKTLEEYDGLVNQLWTKKFSELPEHYHFDFFLAIDGLMVSRDFFVELRRRNPGIKTLLYLYDKIEGNYELNVFFDCYDGIYTFEKSDSLKYNLHHLPIYWTETSKENEDVYDIFGMASYKAGERYAIFTNVRKMAIAGGLRVNISLYHPHVKSRFVYQLKYIIKRLLGKRMLPLSRLQDDIFTDIIMTPDEFRSNICKSKVILDTHNSFQDGLTARFMWAIGTGKKIITTNKNIIEYPFYDPDQVMILDNNYHDIIPFINAPFIMKEEVKNQILKYRIDNWLSTIMGAV